MSLTTGKQKQNSKNGMMDYRSKRSAVHVGKIKRRVVYFNGKFKRLVDNDRPNKEWKDRVAGRVKDKQQAFQTASDFVKKEAGVDQESSTSADSSSSKSSMLMDKFGTVQDDQESPEEFFCRLHYRSKIELMVRPITDEDHRGQVLRMRSQKYTIEDIRQRMSLLVKRRRATATNPSTVKTHHTEGGADDDGGKELTKSGRKKAEKTAKAAKEAEALNSMARPTWGPPSAEKVAWMRGEDCKYDSMSNGCTRKICDFKHPKHPEQKY